MVIDFFLVYLIVLLSSVIKILWIGELDSVLSVMIFFVIVIVNVNFLVCVVIWNRCV